MHERELKFILESYSWKKTDTAFHLLQHVENDTYVVDTSNGKYVLRRYRQGRYSADQVRAELGRMCWVILLPCPKLSGTQTMTQFPIL